MAEATPDIVCPAEGFADRLQYLFATFLAHYGPQGWWPADSRLEIMVGAVLTQNTAWKNVEAAIGNLRRASALELEVLLSVSQDALAEMLRPAGYFNVKARRLTRLLSAVREMGGEDALAGLSDRELRDSLLAVNGVGPETADDILLYAFDRPVFVVDAYTRRLFGRIGLARGDEDYEQLRGAVESAVPGDVGWYQEFHALVVAHAKAYCRPTPVCGGCSVAAECAFAGMRS